MNNAIELSTLSPTEHDLLFVERMRRRLDAQLWVELSAPFMARHYTKDVLVTSMDGRGRTYVAIDYRTEVLPQTYAEAIEVLVHGKEALALYNEGITPRYGSLDYVKEDADKLEGAYLALDDANIAVAQCWDEYYRRPWSRYWLVTSSDGHIHASTECSTCNKGHEPTGFALVPYLSGKTAKDAVADLGSALCSVCFPDAPVEDREQVRISARVALKLAEEGVEAFQQARAKAEADAKKRASERCDGSGQPTIADKYWHKCPVCGNGQRQAGKTRAHRRPRWYAIQEINYNTKYWDGTKWAPSTKKVDLLTKENAQNIVDINGGTGVRSA